MKAFNELFTRIDGTTSTNEKIDALADYFARADPKDAIWCVALLTGRRPKRTVKSAELRHWAAEAAGVPVWLLEESYHIVGDLAETISLLLPGHRRHSDHALHEAMNTLISLEQEEEAERKRVITQFWKELGRESLFVFNKLITGGFRMGVSDKIVIKALAKYFKTDENRVAHRLTGNWTVTGSSLELLFATGDAAEDISKPYPFYLAYALEHDPSELGDIGEWMIERKYDGIRGQIIFRRDELFIWSRGEDLLTPKFTEFHVLDRVLPSGTVIDGEILPYRDGAFLPFHLMQTRIGRKNVTKRSLEEAPLVMVCYDLLESGGVDIRHLSLLERRTMLESLLHRLEAEGYRLPLLLSPLVICDSWEDAARQRLLSREQNYEGLMIKLKSGTYKTGRRRGEWWKWKVDPYNIDGVLMYAQRGHGRRSNLYTDFTFGVWDGDQLVPFTKAYSGLTDKELLEADNWIKKNTLDKFGPVRTVKPELVFELGFEDINPSPRHKSGVALRFPRILRWRKDKTAKEANTKADLLTLLRR